MNEFNRQSWLRETPETEYRIEFRLNFNENILPHLSTWIISIKMEIEEFYAFLLFLMKKPVIGKFEIFQYIQMYLKLIFDEFNNHHH